MLKIHPNPLSPQTKNHVQKKKQRKPKPSPISSNKCNELNEVQLISVKEQSFTEKAAHFSNLFSQYGYNLVCETLW